MSCTLNSGSKLSLMLSTSAGNTSGKNLGTFGKVSSQLKGILIINMLYFVSTERANLFSLLRSEGLLHFRLNFGFVGVVIQSNNLLFNNLFH